MNTKLITALRTTANALEQGSFRYYWRQPKSCNCGALFCALTGKSMAELDRVIPKSLIEPADRSWKGIMGEHCPIAGVPTNELFRKLFECGLTREDILELEYLKNPKVLSRLKETHSVPKRVALKRRWYQKKKYKMVREPLVPVHDNVVHVIVYMRAWADLLTAEGAMDIVTERSGLTVSPAPALSAAP